MRLPWFVAALLVGWATAGSSAPDGSKIKLSECPEAVRKSIGAEAPGAKIEFVNREKDEDDDVVFWAEATIGERTYEIGILEDGTLSEMNMVPAGGSEVAFDGAPAAVKATFKAEAFGLTIRTLARDLKYGTTTYDAVVDHAGKSYEIVVAEDGTLVEKVLVIDDEDVELAACPEPVREALKKLSKGGAIDGITRSAGIGKPTFEAEVELKGKVYLIELDDAGTLISKSLQASQE